jgi:segregation and condensation protein A
MTISHLATYTVATPIYEGPLDLLLQLIERAELDITRLALAQVTDQYLEHIRNLEVLQVDDVSAFLLIAAKLLQIKSEALLPRPPVREVGEEDPGDALTRQLLAYKRFRKVAEWLSAREESGLRTYLRLVEPPRIEGQLDLTGITLQDFAAAAREVFVAAQNRRPLSTIVAPPRITIREKIALITRMLRSRKNTTFNTLVEGHRTRLDIVVTFLALLELVKRHLITAYQEKLFGEIALHAEQPLEEDTEYELEFGE